MKKLQLKSATVNVAKLKNQLSRYLGLTKKGHEVIVVEHNRPIAKVIPFSEVGVWSVRAPLKTLNVTKWLSLPLVKRDWDVVDILLEDRRKR